MIVLPNIEHAIGGKPWWSALAPQGNPLIKDLGNCYSLLTFLWRAPPKEHVAQVFIDVWSLTPHATQGPTEMINYPATNVWYWQVCVASDWRGSYFFVPVACRQSRPQQFSARRRWWIALLEQYGQADTLSLLPPYQLSGHRWISQLDLGETKPLMSSSTPPIETFNWCSQQLEQTRKVWLYQAKKLNDSSLPDLVILLDGRYWAQSLDIVGSLTQMSSIGELRPALYVFIDAVDATSRYRDMTCNPTFWQALTTELLPQLALKYSFTDKPERSLVIGQSLGGLAACFAGLFFSHRFGQVISLSGSFWWRDDVRGSLLEMIVKAPSSAKGQFHIGIGCYEDEMQADNKAMADALIQAGHQVKYHQFRGGHDWVCWRQAILRALSEPSDIRTDSQFIGGQSRHKHHELS